MLGAPSDFGSFLIERGLLSDTSWHRAQDVLSEARQGLAGTVTGLGLLSENDLSLALKDYFKLPLAQDEDWPLDVLSIPDINPTFLRSCHILPAYEEQGTIIAIVADPSDDYAKRALEFASGKPVSLKVSTLRQVEAAITQLYFGGEVLEDNSTEGLADDVDRLKELATDAPVIRFVDRMIDDALSRRASDIHVEPSNGLICVRFRIDGMLSEVPGPSKDIAAAVVSRLKIMSGLDIAERRLAQDGRMRVRAHGKEIDFRVSTSPTSQGEAVVLRLLDKKAVALDFKKLGFDDTVQKPFLTALKQPDGIVLVTGPTGSGKTTTLYTGLSELNTTDRKILTVEDPVEYSLDGLGQVQVDNRIGRTFANTLRSFLRQDPDVIMVGEIRDNETAGIAVQASLTGHLVLSTLHTNSAAAAISRLLDMGVQDYLIASTLKLVIAQRLVRKICPACVKEDHPPPTLIDELGLSSHSSKFYTGGGCAECHGSGFNGRKMIAEVLEITPELEKAILAHKSGTELENIAKASGMRTLFAHGLESVTNGTTSLSEVIRVTRERG